MGFILQRIVCALLLSSVFSISVLAAPQSRSVPPTPIPPQILAAKKVFIGNAGGDTLYGGLSPSSPDRPYNQFYAAMKSWGHYELVLNPVATDLLLEISFVVHMETEGLCDPQLRLVIRDPKTSAVLWGFIIHVDWAILPGNRDKNLDAAMKKLVESVQKLATPPTGGAPRQD